VLKKVAKWVGKRRKKGDGMEIDDDGSVNQTEISAELFEQPRWMQ
jgi:hypothetical protein